MSIMGLGAMASESHIDIRHTDKLVVIPRNMFSRSGFQGPNRPNSGPALGRGVLKVSPPVTSTHLHGAVGLIVWMTHVRDEDSLNQSPEPVRYHQSHASSLFLAPLFYQSIYGQ